MTSLEEFLNKDNKPNPTNMEPASGSFNCQTNDCNETVYTGYINRDSGRLLWICSQGHESSVVI
jgi:hypothetical protein